MVREGHRPEGQTEIRLLFDFRRDAEGRTDQKARRAAPGELDLLELLRQPFAGQLRPLRGQHAEPRALGKLLDDQLGLLAQTRRDLRRARVVGQARFGQLDERKFAVAFQPFLVFLHRGKVEFLFQLADGQQRYAEHQRKKPSRIFSSACCASRPRVMSLRI